MINQGDMHKAFGKFAPLFQHIVASEEVLYICMLTCINR